MVERQHGKFGWYAKGSPKILEMFKFESMQVFSEADQEKNRPGLYQLKWFFDTLKTDPDQFLQLTEELRRQRIAVACRAKKSPSASQVMFYMVQKFLELNGKPLVFTRTQKHSMFKRSPYKNGTQCIPKPEDVYRMVDSFPRRDAEQQLRGKALILCQWQSGVRSTCLCDWRYGMFKDKLNPENAPLPLKILSKRERNNWTAAVDTKLSSYGLGYYNTFLGKEAIQALGEYLETRKKNGWQLKDEDHVFVTEGTVKTTRGKPLTARHVLNNVKTAAQQIGLDPSTVWAHLLRKSFRNCLRRAGLEDQVCEALMGHTLPNSQGSYFDASDMEQARREYKAAARNFSRISNETVEQLQDEMPKKTSEIELLKQQVAELSQQIHKIVSTGVVAARPHTDEELAEIWKDELAKGATLVRWSKKAAKKFDAEQTMAKS